MSQQEQDINDFFGFGCHHSCSSNSNKNSANEVSPKTSVWTNNDCPLGESIVHHYNCFTIPRLQSPQWTNTTATSSLSSSTYSTTSNSWVPNNTGHGIPPFIHFIWLGDSKNLPLRRCTEMDCHEYDYAENECIKSWRRHHPQWMLQVWRDEDLLSKHAMAKWFNADAIQFALEHKNYGMASDILRLELLYEYGGLYVDIDYLCTDTVSHLHQQFEFYCGASNTGAIELNNGLLACQPRHALIQYMRERIHHSWMHVLRPQSFQFAALLQQSAFLDEETLKSWERGMMLKPQDVIRYTGPGLLTTCVAEVLMTPVLQTREFDPSRLAVLPYQTFHPIPNNCQLGRDWNEIYRNLELLDEYIVAGETKAIHLWQCTWVNASSQALK